MLAMEVAILSERGGRPYNEDACGHWHSKRHLACVLADGAGGHGGGDLASRLAVQNLLAAVQAHPEDCGEQLAGLVRQTNQAILDQRRPGTRSADMHSTVVCLVVDFIEHRAYWAHAGDSRLYWFRNGRLNGRTLDHSLVQGLVEVGLVSEAELRHHPRRSELRSALGTQPDELDVSARSGPAEIAAGDCFLLCSDGLWENLDDRDLEATLATARAPGDWLDALRRIVTAATAGKPGYDNFSAMALWLSQPNL
ncbi:PP2C family protein-serine/threonine phosphatase [Roseateles sp. BYS78W]|uniref:PP2C family protein-serine/threonine phosphatase n=1 Tax=Pelomonas candidula TaxID=3299025 RepID=A0ABW7HKD2_9BURK